MEFEKSALNQVKRGARKASYDQETIYAILDATEICHIAFNFNGKPFVQPINFGRNGDKLYLHGAHHNRMTSALLESKEVCLNVMILDALKLTRSAYHHSVNYRSVVVFGSIRELTNEEEKLHGLKSIINHFVPDRWDYCRHPNAKELNATRVLEIQIESASAKIANEPPADKEEDLALDYWAGTIPLKTIYQNPKPDQHMDQESVLPDHVQAFIDQRNR